MARVLNSTCPRAIDCRAAAFGPPALAHRGVEVKHVAIELAAGVDPLTKRLQRQEERAAARALRDQASRLIVFRLRGEERTLELHNLPQLRIRRRMFRLGMHQDRVLGLAAQVGLPPVPHDPSQKTQVVEGSGRR